MPKFTIRVYGVIIEDGKLLLSREQILNKLYVKLPGGGLEYGEGTRDCLQREILEETGLQSEIGDHVYTTDFFQPSAFHSEPTQVMSIYYRAKLIDSAKLEVNHSSSSSGFFCVDLKELNASHVDLPIDKVVVRQIVDAL
jgi:8-oxo-dGTP diphosphatase